MSGIGIGTAVGFTHGGWGGGITAPANMVSMVAYDSIENYFKSNQTQLQAAYVSAGFTSSTGTGDFATPGCHLLKSTAVAIDGAESTLFLINDDSGTDPAGWVKSDLYNTLDANYSDKSVIKHIMISGGINDSSAGTTATKTNTKQALTVLCDWLLATYTDVQIVTIDILGRTFGASTIDANYQNYREAQLEFIAEYPRARRGIEIYAADLRDTGHPTTTWYQVEGARAVAVNTAYHYGLSDNGTNTGPNPITAVYDGYGVLTTYTHGAGTDFAAIPSGAEAAFALNVDGTVFKASKATRINATQIYYDFANKGIPYGDVYSFKHIYGSMDGLSQTSAEVIKDNATNPLPVNSAVLTPTISHPLLPVDDLSVHMMFGVAEKTYSAAAALSSADDRMGKNWASASGDELDFDVSVFPKGAVVAADGNRFMQCENNSWVVSNTGWGGVVFKIPDSTVASKYLLTFEGSNTIAFYLTFGTGGAGGALYYQQNSANSVELVSGTESLLGKKCFLTWDFQSLTVAVIKLYVEGGGYHEITIDPRDSLIAWNRITIGNRTAAETGGQVGIHYAEIFHRNTARGTNENDPTSADLAAFYDEFYGLGL